MTPEQRRQINETIARAMGATNPRTVTLFSLAGLKEITVYDPPPGQEMNYRILDSPETGVKAFSAYVPPDFTRDAAASRELFKWLREQPRTLRNRFEDAFGEAIDRKGEGLDYLDVLSADLETIAQAAFQAIGGKLDE